MKKLLFILIATSLSSALAKNNSAKALLIQRHKSSAKRIGATVDNCNCEEFAKYTNIPDTAKLIIKIIYSDCSLEDATKMLNHLLNVSTKLSPDFRSKLKEAIASSNDNKKEILARLVLESEQNLGITESEAHIFVLGTDN